MVLHLYHHLKELALAVNLDIILHFPVPILTGLHQLAERPIQRFKHSYPTGRCLRMIPQQALTVGHMGITHLHPPRLGLLHLKRLFGVRHRILHGEYQRLVVHGVRRPQQDLMVLHKRHTHLGFHNKPNNPKPM